MSAPLTKDQAFALCMDMQAEWFRLHDLMKDGGEVVLSAMTTRVMAATAGKMAIKAGQVAGFIIPGLAPANDDDGDAA